MTNAKILPAHPAYANSVTAALRDSIEGTSFDGDPYKFAETLYRMVNAVGTSGGGQKLPLYLPIGEDALAGMQHKLKRGHKWLVDAAPWSEDLKKDKAKL